MQPETPTAFFRYSREDSSFALRLAQDLKAAGANVWIDQLDIEPGQEWDSAVEAAVTQAPRMLLILSPASVKSRNVRNEISFALDESKTILPVLYQDCTVPLQLHRVQYIDLRTDDSRGLTVLLRALGVPLSAASVANAAIAEASQPLLQGAKETQLPAGQAGRGEGRRSPVEYRRAAENKSFIQERSDDVVSNQRSWMKAGLTACAILIAVLGLYWALSRSRQPKEESQSPATQDAQLQRSEPQSSTPPKSGQPVPSESKQGSQQSEAGTGAAKPAFAEPVAPERRGGPQGGQSSNQNSKLPSREVLYASPPAQPVSSGVPAGGALPADLDPKYADLYRRAQGGDTLALVLIGKAYRTENDYTKALTWYGKAADAGNTWGMTSLGEMYEDGTGVDKNYKEAVSWYRKAANAGDRDGMYYLGVMYEKGYGVNQDQQQALIWYRKSAKLGLGDAENALTRLGESPQ